MKVVIIGGAGGIGASTAFNLLLADGTYDIVLVDTRPNMVLSHTMDFENALAISKTADTVRGGTAEDLVDADVVVLSAAVPLRLNSSRSVFLKDNARVVDDCLALLPGSGFQGIVLFLTNPVDPLVTMVHRQGWLPAGRMLGYTLNDSLRLRTGIATALGVHPREVDAWVLGEHGEAQVPLWDRVTVRGTAVALSGDQRAVAQEYADSWYPRHVALDSGRTSTWTTGLGAARMIEAMATDSGAVFPASVLLDGEYGVHGVSLGVPVAVGRAGVREVLHWELTSDQRDGMRSGARHVAEAVASLSSVPGGRGRSGQRGLDSQGDPE